MSTPETIRISCWCEKYRQPCAYHEGWIDGYEAALDGLFEHAENQEMTEDERRRSLDLEY